MTTHGPASTTVTGTATPTIDTVLALVRLPDYLEKLAAGGPDIPLVLQPLINDLRTIRDLIRRCPDRKNPQCRCAAHQTLGRRDDAGRWIGIHAERAGWSCEEVCVA